MQHLDRFPRHDLPPLLAGLVASIFILLLGALRPPQLAYDDAFITYRYADNLRRGLGLVYNPGEWVLGTTTPLLALLLGALGLLFSDLVAVAHWLGVLAWVVAVWAAIGLFWQERRPWTAVAASLLVATQPALLPSLGMETPLLAALMLCSAWSWLGGRRWLTIFLAAALLLARQDSALWLTLLGLEIWRRKRVLPWRETVGAILMTAPWFVYAQLRYGSIVPNSVKAKVGQSAVMAVGGQTAFLRMGWDMFTAGMHPVVVVMAIAVAALGLWSVVRSARGWWWLPTWAALYLLVYSLLGVAGFAWYFIPPFTAISLLTALGLGWLAGERGAAPVDEQSLSRRKLVSALPAAGAVALLLGLLVNRAAVLSAALDNRGYRADYSNAGQWLAANTPPGARVAAIEIGVIGYLSRRPILDTMGLVSPDMTRHQLGWRETLAYALNVHQPEYAVVLPDTAWDGIVGEWWFLEQYEIAERMDQLSIYRRRAETAPALEFQLEARYADGFSLTRLLAAGAQLVPGEPLDLRLETKTYAAPSGRYSFTIFLVDAQTFARYGVSTTEPLSGGYGTDKWQPGDRLTLPMRLNVPADLPTGAYQLGIALYEIDRGEYLRLADAPDVPEPDVRAGWFRLGAPEAPYESSELSSTQLNIKWQEGITLDSISLPTGTLSPGSAVPARLTLHSAGAAQRDLTVFLHLLDSGGQIVAQVDRRPFEGRFPTTVWRAGEKLTDSFVLTLPADLPAGSYALRIGFYDQQGRLALEQGGADYLDLVGAVTIESAR